MALEFYHVQNNEDLKTFIDELSTPGRLELRELIIDLSLRFESTTLHLERETLSEYLQHLQSQTPLFSNLQAFTLFVDLPVPYPVNQNYFDFDLFNEIIKYLDSREDWRGDTHNVTMQGVVYGIYSFWSKVGYKVNLLAIFIGQYNDI